MIVSVAIPRPVDGLFTYKISDELARELKIGGWVRVPFGRSTVRGYVIEEAKSEDQLPITLELDGLKSVLEVAGPEEFVLTSEVLALCKWAHEYYRSPLGEVLNCAAPSSTIKKKSQRAPKELLASFEKNIELVELTEDQKSACDALEAFRVSAQPSPKVALLHGVTGSGKTEVYLRLARSVLAEGKSVLLLVPEIALTTQLHERFERGLGTAVGLWHSAMAEGRKRSQLLALKNKTLRVLVGARSAVFAPMTDLGLIIIDEEHDASYKQEDRVRYHARDLSIVRARLSGALVVLGSATPSLESRERVREGKYLLVKLPNRIALGGLPEVEIVNLCEEEQIETVRAPLAKRTLEAIQATIDCGNQVMVFLNRRGFAAFLVCEDCGEVKECSHCSISLTVHQRARQLRCHVCGHHEPIPDLCIKCHGSALAPVGAGTESLEDELPGLVRGMIPIRLDRDQITSATRLAQVLNDFREGRANALLGTQMLAKGHDFPKVTLVVVILADGLFRWPDFRAPERAYQLLTQVAGRAGRSDQLGRVMIQTYNPEHPVLQAVQGRIDPEMFLESERELRLALGYPPFGRLVRFRFENADKAIAQGWALEAAQVLTTAGQVEILGPSEAFLERAKGIYRWDLLVKAKEIGSLQKAVTAVKNRAWQKRWQYLVDVDPYAIG